MATKKAKAAKPAVKKAAKPEKAAPKAKAKAEKPAPKMSASDIITLVTTFEPILAQILAAFAKKDPTAAAKAKKQFAKIKAAAEASAPDADEDDEESEDEEGDDEVAFPSAKEVAKMGMKDLKATAAKIDFDPGKLKESALRALLGALATFIADLQEGTAPAESEALTKENAAKVAVALSVEPGKNHKATLEAIADTLAADDEDESEDEDEDEDEEDEAPKKGKKSKKKSSDDDDDDEEEDDEEESEDDEDEDSDDEDEDEDDDEEEDEDSEDDDESEDDEDEDDEEEDEDDEEDEDEDEAPDRAAVAKAAAASEFPDKAEMQERLDAYNEAVGDGDEDDEDAPQPIEVEAGKLKTAYRALLERLVTQEGEIAEWGEPYQYNGEVMCCGVGLESVKIKGVKQAGKCAVTGKTFSIDEEGEATEIKAKKSKK